MLLRRFLIGALLVALAACAPSSTPTLPPSSPIPTPFPTFTPQPPAPTSAFVEATPASPLVVDGLFVYAAGDGSLMLQDARDSEPVALVERSTEAIAQMPAFALDGKQVAYAALLFLPDDALRGDIRAVDTDGENVRTLVKAEANEVVYFYPRFARDGRLLVTRTEQPQTTNERAWLEWVDVRGEGTRTRIIENARDGDVSRDGTRVAFVRYDVATLRSGLWVANADGSNPVQVVDDTTFTAILNPRFSLDGKWLAFGVHGAPQKSLPLALHKAQQECAFAVLIFCVVQTTHAHAAPGALWRVELETRKFQQLTNVYDDSPVPAWSGSAGQVAIHDYTGIRLIDLTRREIYPLFLQDGGNGGFDWTR